MGRWVAQFGRVAVRDGPAVHLPVEEGLEATGKAKWRQHIDQDITTAPALDNHDTLYIGAHHNSLYALDAKTGSKLWSFQTGAGHRGSAISYSVNGRQYIATPTGWGSIAGNGLGRAAVEGPAPRGGSALIVFALPEDAK